MSSKNSSHCSPSSSSSSGLFRAFCKSRTVSAVASWPRNSNTCRISSISILPDLSASNFSNTVRNLATSSSRNTTGGKLASNSSCRRCCAAAFSAAGSTAPPPPIRSAPSRSEMSTVCGVGVVAFRRPAPGSTGNHKVAKTPAAATSIWLSATTRAFTDRETLGRCRHRNAATKARIPRLSRALLLKSTPSQWFPRIVRKITSFCPKLSTPLQMPLYAAMAGRCCSGMVAGKVAAPWYHDVSKKVFFLIRWCTRVGSKSILQTVISSKGLHENIAFTKTRVVTWSRVSVFRNGWSIEMCFKVLVRCSTRIISSTSQYPKSQMLTSQCVAVSRYPAMQLTACVQNCSGIALAREPMVISRRFKISSPSTSPGRFGCKCPVTMSTPFSDNSIASSSDCRARAASAALW
mmetsp:Transcript_116995/g.268524  ORF Transcript_116995/g.268524 Transcript_116995/m.268524 type:complete len:406 (-) Transcript_116995:732-1949(-)